MRPHAALLALLLVGCASAPDRLTVTAAAASAAGTTLTAESRRLEADFAADLQERFAACTGLPVQRTICRSDARAAAYAAVADRQSRLVAAINAQRTAADALEAADTCRRRGEACDETKRLDAEAALRIVEALLLEVRRAR